VPEQQVIATSPTTDDRELRPEDLELLQQLDAVLDLPGLPAALQYHLLDLALHLLEGDDERPPSEAPQAA
jgi:hypothetical protein